MVEAGRADVRHMLLEAEVSREYHPKHSNMLTRCEMAAPSCRDGKLSSPIERERLVPAQSSSVLSMLSFSRLADTIVNVHDALLKSSDGRRHVIATTVQVQLCAVCK